MSYTILTAPAISTDTTYTNVDGSDVTVTNTDNDASGITVTPTTLTTTEAAGGTATITVDTSQQFQTVLGVGSSLEESTIYNLSRMSAAGRDAALRALVDPVNGAGFNVARITLGTSDFTSHDFYTYDDGTAASRARDQRAVVEAGPADDDRQPPARDNVRDRGARDGGPARRVKRFVRADEVQRVVGHAAPLFDRRLGRADVHADVDLRRIAGDDLAAGALREGEAQRALARRRRAQHGD